jgi:hypothetical protein
MEANLTGMELLSPLTAIFSKEPAGVGQRQIFVLTDGEVRNAPDILCYGIGRGALEAPVRRTGSFVAPRRAEGACMAQE